MVYAKATNAIEKAVLQPPKTWRDVDIADKVARRTIGLDTEAGSNNAVINLAVLNSEVGGPEPMFETESVTDLSVEGESTE
jgi:hypothetical protein